MLFRVKVKMKKYISSLTLTKWNLTQMRLLLLLGSVKLRCQQKECGQVILLNLNAKVNSRNQLRKQWNKLRKITHITMWK